MPQYCRWLTICVLTLFLAGCVISPRRPDPNAGNNNTTTPPPTPTPPPPPPTPLGKLYVSNKAANTIVRFNDAMGTSTTGNISPAATISGSSTQLDQPGFLLVDPAADRLFVVNLNLTAPAILVFDSVSTKTGNVAPNRVIGGAALTTPTNLAYDKAHDVLYVVDGPDVLAFDAASTSSGNVAPGRTLTPAFANIGAMLYDGANDRLFLADVVGNAINVYDTASTLTGNITANRTITGPSTGLATPVGLRLDANAVPRLVVSNANPKTPSLTVYGTPGTATGDVAPAATISGANTGLTGPGELALNPAGSGELYVLDIAGKVLIFNNFATASGNIPPSRTISGSNTGLGTGTPATPTAVGIALDTTH